MEIKVNRNAKKPMPANWKGYLVEGKSTETIGLVVVDDGTDLRIADINYNIGQLRNVSKSNFELFNGDITLTQKF